MWMARRKVLCSLAAPLVALVAAAGAGASTTAGGAVTQVWRNTPGYIASSASCAAFRPAPAVEQTGLVAVTRGSYGAPYESNGAQLQQVHVTARLSGTILDADGNRYRASGTFSDDTIHKLFTDSLRFDGTGRFVAHGPAGAISARATFRIVTGPPEVQLTLADAGLCRFR
jgi:hypothetical protein